MNTMHKLIFTFILGLMYFGLNAQDTLEIKEDGEVHEVIVLEQVIVGEDTLAAMTLEPVEISVAPYPELDARTKRYLRKVYPYALRTSRILDKIDMELATMESGREKKKYVKSTEKLLKETFKEDIKNLTRMQGRLLVKLIHRETGLTVNELIREYRGGGKAAWWQMLGKMFKIDLKDEYKPDDEDRGLELYVQKLDQVYQRTGYKEELYENEKFDPSVQDKKRERRRDRS